MVSALGSVFGEPNIYGQEIKSEEVNRNHNYVVLAFASNEPLVASMRTNNVVWVNGTVSRDSACRDSSERMRRADPSNKAFTLYSVDSVKILDRKSYEYKKNNYSRIIFFRDYIYD